jgi:hypothetical protein
MPALPSRLVAGLVATLMLCALGALSAWWAIQLAYPPREVAAPRPSEPPVNRLADASRHLAQPRQSGAQNDSLTALDIRLIGVVAAGQAGRAVVLAEGKPRTLAVGDEVSPGVELARVGKNFIDISAGPARSRIELIEPKKPAGRGGKS